MQISAQKGGREQPSQNTEQEEWRASSIEHEWSSGQTAETQQRVNRNQWSQVSACESEM
jgi:hypothetical protein